MNSLWFNDTKEKLYFDRLDSNINVDVCIIGGGISGLTTAYYLSKRGVKVAVLERDEICSKATGHTTAKITYQHNLIYNYLLNTWGYEIAKGYFEANSEAISNIKNIIDMEKIDCDFEFQDNYVYTTNQSELTDIEREIKAISKLGGTATFVSKTPLPFKTAGAILTTNQAQFHPIKYVLGLCTSILKYKGNIYTNTIAIDVKKEDNKYTTYTDRYKVSSKYVVMATHYPFINFPGLYFSKMYQSTSYAIAIDTHSNMFDGMYINPKDPIFSFRTAKYNERRLLIIGGANHRTGETKEYKDTYGVLENKAKEHFPKMEVLFRWNTRDCITLDKIPYIGQYSSLMPNLYVITGFNKWGMTSSNVAAKIISDNILNIENKYAFVFNSTRVNPIKNKGEIKNMIVSSSNSLLFNKFKQIDTSFDDIKNDSGAIIKINGENVGIYKDTSGNVFAIKPVCTHLGCLLSWNDTDKTWDCPCHGSRFDYMGKNIYDPAMKDLKKYNI